MKTIKVMETKWDILPLYQAAITKASRGLLGYMIKTGRSDDLIFGGAFSLLREIESCHGLYRLKLHGNYKEIIYITEIAQNGGFDKFAISKTEIKRITNMLGDIM